MDTTRDHLPLVLAAAQAAGPHDGDSEAWLQRVQHLAVELHLLARQLGERLERIDAAAVFTGTIVDVRIEASSTRAIVRFRPDKTTQDRELEEIRTERGDTPEGTAMIARARAMVGHRAVFYKYNEKMESAGAAPKGSTVRILVHLVDLGRAPVAQPPGRHAKAPV